MEQTNQSSFVYRALAAMMLVVLILGSLIYFDTLLRPIVIAIVIWYLIRSLNIQISRIHLRDKKLPRWIRVIISIVVINAMMLGAYQLILVNVNSLLKNVDVYDNNFTMFLTQFGDFFGIPDIIEKLESRIEELDVQGFVRNVLASVTVVVGDFLIILIYVIFLLLEEAMFQKKIDIIFQNRNSRSVRHMISQINESTDRYLLMKTYVSLITGGISYIILLIAGVDFAFLWAFLIFLLNYIPYIGSLIATLLPSVFAILQFGSVWPGIWVFVFVESVQLIVGNYVEPKLMGKSLNLSPFVVVLALSVWGYIWGILGMLLSVPITSILLIVLAQFPSTRAFAVLLTEKGDINSLIITDEPDKPK